MPDRIDKKALEQINPYESYRVEKNRDATEEEREQSQEDESEGDKDGFNSEAADNLYQNLTQKSSQKKSSVSLAIDDIEIAWFEGIDLKTDPSYLTLKIQTFVDERIFLVKTKFSRAQALRLKSTSEGKSLNLKDVFSDSQIWVEVMHVFASPDEEVTKVSIKPQDYTMSQTVKMSEKKSFWQKIRVLDENREFNLEITLALATALAVLVFLIIGGLYLIN